MSLSTSIKTFARLVSTTANNANCHVASSILSAASLYRLGISKAYRLNGDIY